MKLKDVVAAGTSLSVGVAGNTVTSDIVRDSVAVSPVIDSRQSETFAAGENTFDATAISIEVVADEEWDASKERRFSLLAALKAAEKIDAGQLRELDKLRKFRRRERNPISTAEMMFQYRRREMESRILKELQNYVEFLGTARRS